MDTVKNIFHTRKNSATNENISLSNFSNIERFIINPSITIGSLYDARNDSIVGILDENIQSKKEKLNENLLHTMYKGKDIKLENLFKYFHIDSETCLSTILKINEPQGILSIINYSYLIDNLTRFIYYFQPIEEESLVNDFGKHKHLLIPSTHLISKIKFGISFLIILQLFSQNSLEIEKFDHHLEDLLSKFDNNIDIEQIIPNEKEFSENIHRTKIYSNINDLSRLNNIYELYQQIQIIKHHSYKYRPLTFTLTPINYFYSKFDLIKNYISINEQYTIDIESSIIPLAFNINILKKDLKFLKKSLLKIHTQQELYYAIELFKDFENIYLKHLERLANAIIQVRSRDISQEHLAQLLNTEEKQFLFETKDNIIKYFNDLKSKNSLIIELEQKQIEYLNVFNTDINQDDNQQNLVEKLIKNNRNIHILCSNDDLRKDNHQFNEQINKLIESQINKNNIHLIYADFSYTSYHLEQFQIIYSKYGKKKKVIGPSKINLNKRLSKSESKLNIILFGESGVGKSTFINAFANYLLYENLNQARSNQLIVLIPVSFLITINDQFDERLIQFGHQHPNEYHNNLGQSVTQQCKSYEFSTRDGKFINIIDTPGFGDTRGLDQDEKNLQEIFSYIENLTHLNALCILLKPNIKELNPSFKISFKKIFQYLGEKFSKNIFFCFTNSQSTFFTLGDTGPILNKYLESYQINLNKENTYCFDSESFRYLVASQDLIEFDQQFIEQFQQSWMKSVHESNRFIKQIYLEEIQNNINHKWISNQQIKQEIIYLIRPILEAIRNIFRNIILSENETYHRSIQLISIPLDSPRLICYKLDRSYQTFGEFHILLDYFHKSSIQCEYEHLNTDYTLNYRFIIEKTDYSSEDANIYLYGMIKSCAHFDYFLNDNYQKNKDGPFLSGIYRMVQEEKSICEREQSSDFNKKLKKRLKKLEERYQIDSKEINDSDKYAYLKSIYSRIEGIKQMPVIYQQLIYDKHHTIQRENDK